MSPTEGGSDWGLFLNRDPGNADHSYMPEEEEFVWAVKGEGHLVTNMPGASAREQADALRAEQPIVTRIARLLGEHNDERAYRIGPVAEEEVGRRLARLDDRWMVINDIWLLLLPLYVLGEDR